MNRCCEAGFVLKTDHFLQADQLMKIIFSKAHALCHDVNTTTKTPLHLDVILGFSTSDIMWYEPFSQKYTRINKNVSPILMTCKRSDR